MMSTDVLGLARSRRRLLVAATAVCCLTYIGGWERYARGDERDELKPEQQLQKLFGGDDDKEGPFIPLIKGAESATAYRIDPRYDLTAEKTVAGYPILGQPVRVDADLVKELGQALLDKRTYGWQGPTFCGFAPGIAIRYHGKGEGGMERRAVVLLCFECDDIVVHVSDPFAESRVENFMPGRAKLVRLVKRIFPKDKEIQELVEMRPEPEVEEVSEEEKKRRSTAAAQERAEDLFWPQLDAVLDPAKVEAYRIGPKRDATSPGRLNGHRVLAGPVKVDDKLATEFARTLVNGKSYDWEAVDDGSCSPRPSIVVVFSGDDRGEFTERVAVYFCFSCDRVTVHFSPSLGVQEATFKPARGPFIKLLKHVFKDDKFVQALREDGAGDDGFGTPADESK
jgi:hypothetical protein